MPLTVFSDEYYMKQAYQEAQAALEAEEIPIGAVVVCNNKVIARAHNQTETLNDVTAHAEMLAHVCRSPMPCPYRQNHLGCRRPEKWILTLRQHAPSQDEDRYWYHARRMSLVID